MITLDAETLRDPYPTYARLRELPGLARHPREGFWWVARYDDVRDAALRTGELSSRLLAPLMRSLRVPRTARRIVELVGPEDVLATEDPPRHALHRKLSSLAKPIVARALADASPMLSRAVERLVARGGDLVAELAAPIPPRVALGLLGFPARDAALVKALSDASVALLSGLPSPRRGRESLASLALYSYCLSRVELARRRGTSSEVLGALLDARLGTRETASIVLQLLIAGSDSTTSLLGTVARLLADSPELAARLRDDPSLRAPLVEEGLRLESPFQGHFRVATADTVLAGTEVRAGDRLMLLWGAANRDPRAFVEPDDVRLDRRQRDRPHLGFGHGIHLCIGAALARAISVELVTTLVSTGRTLRRVGPVDHAPSGFVRTLRELRVSFDG